MPWAERSSPEQQSFSYSKVIRSFLAPSYTDFSQPRQFFTIFRRWRKVNFGQNLQQTSDLPNIYVLCVHYYVLFYILIVILGDFLLFHECIKISRTFCADLWFFFLSLSLHLLICDRERKITTITLYFIPTNQTIESNINQGSRYQLITELKIMQISVQIKSWD